MEFEELYQEIILDHYRYPRNKGDLSHLADEYIHENPACGDRVKVEIHKNSENYLDRVTFDGSGCAICTASASMMSELLKGKDIRAAEKLINTFIAVMREEKDKQWLDTLGDIAAFKSLVKLPVRVKCATLSWHAALTMLQNQY